MFEALAMADPAIGSFLSIHNMCGGMIDKFGSEETKQKWLPSLCIMEKIFSYCLTEPGSGSDAAALKTRAERSNEGYILNGTKAFISGGSYSDAYVVMCRTGEDGPKGISTVVVEDGAKGLSFGALEDKMGWKAQPTSQVQFDDCAIPADNLIGEEGKGFSYAMAGLDGGRLNISAGALGGAQAALDQTVQYMSERKAFGKSINQFQALQFRLAEYETRLQAARTFLRQAAWKLDTGAHDATKFCAMAKLMVTDTAFDVANGCLQLHGRLRLPGRLRRREDRPRSAGAPDPGRHQRDHAPDRLATADCRLRLPAPDCTARTIDGAHQMSDIHIRKFGQAGRITFTRPKALNAMSYEMCIAIDAAMRGWANDDTVKLVVIDAEGDKAFCAGGDIAELYDTGTKGDYSYGRSFWRDEYRLNARIFEYKKPVISFMQASPWAAASASAVTAPTGLSAKAARSPCRRSASAWCRTWAAR